MSELALLLVLTALAAWSVWRLPPLHPAQLWSVPWALATLLYVLHLLPYRSLATTTVVIAGLAGTAFVLCAVLGDRWVRRKRPAVTRWMFDRYVIERAALLAAALTGILLLAFLVQSASRYGLSATLVSSPRVRRAIGAGDLAATIKFVYAAIAAVALCAMAAGSSSTRASRIRWATLGALCGASVYFSTGRSTLVTVLIVGIVGYLLTKGLVISRGRFVAGTAALAAIAVVVLILGGLLIGKTYANNADLRSVDSVFTRHTQWSSLALPYQYGSAPIAALDVQVKASTTWGVSHGCALFAEVCDAVARLGADVHGESRVRPFTAAPLRWNTYTALDVPLMDGGLALAVPIVGIIGLLMGALWDATRARSSPAILAYSVLAPAAVNAYGSFSFTAPHLIGALVIGLGLATGVRLWARRTVTAAESASTRDDPSGGGDRTPGPPASHAKT